ncbi:NYN domain-containing protein [Muricoccus aerilatus]|uniref:NYN domain-containing protein n=1 Tax=Muricoccus aerilatus TaxID=452982 RepID=UPI0005C2202D|nr:NYN domain-containing protein [Roseomonas aerilata]
MPFLGKPERSVRELYQDDPERSDALVWGRRGALKGAALGAMGAALGVTIPFAARLPGGLLPVALAQPTSAGGGPRMMQRDRITLAAGDGDYERIVKQLVADGFVATVLYWAHASRELREAATAFYALDPCFADLALH